MVQSYLRHGPTEVRAARLRVAPASNIFSGVWAGMQRVFEFALRWKTRVCPRS